ncbi:MAG: hypothetical protein CME62_13685 [Halobacteriovoraceae bacterium]|nr:hypothetical protein [Halobacteriovoraceae bacterium]|tara:strand:+ start:1494 stop:1997 length:504 start_codon:yes stop_codon:yes gene_type:complete
MNQKIIILFTLIIGIIVARNYFFDSDKREIKAAINNLQESLEFDKSLPPLEVIGRLNNISKYFIPVLTTKYLEYGEEKKSQSNFNIENLKAAAVLGARTMSSITLDKSIMSIQVNNDIARSAFDLTITGRDISNETFKELFQMTLEFKKTDGKWLCHFISADRVTPD